MRIPFLFIIGVVLSVVETPGAIEIWADPRLPVTEGLQIWIDPSRQPAAFREKGLRPLLESTPVWLVMDASGNRRDFVQNLLSSMPKLVGRGQLPALRFDGNDDFLACYPSGFRLTNLTIFIVGAPRTNAGGFRSFFAATKAGANDFLTGINIDLGAGPATRFSSINIEGAGIGGFVNLLREPFELGKARVLTVVSTAGPGGVKLFADGRPQETRDRSASTIFCDEVLLGARLYSNSAEPPNTSGFLCGDIAEVLVYDRALPEAERIKVEEYLTRKHATALASSAAPASGLDPLSPVINPPPIQMFLPGFVSRELPVKLPNINCIKYRPDGKLLALGYNGNLYLLSATSKGELENRVENFWETNSLRAPIGMALTPPGYPFGQGAFVAAKGKVSLIVDTNGDDRADREIVIAQGWKEISHGVDALGVAVGVDGSVYFGLGVADFTNPYLIDRASGQSRFDLNTERGTILKVAPDFKSREVVCTGIRFPVALAFNSSGDLFCTDQEGATWLPNGNPLDELLHIQDGRHYGFPPRHSSFLPNVSDEPSTFDYGPQHQSICGLNFNPVAGATFGPASWGGDAFLAGYSRGKLFRTKLVRSAAGYVAETQLIAALNMLTVDACVSPNGDLVVATHSGQPDWGSGPTGLGKLYRIQYGRKNLPRPVRAWAENPNVTRIEFDRPLSAEQVRLLVDGAAIAGGKYLVAGERFESILPGYQVVQDQLATERFRLPILSAQISPNRRALSFETPLRARAVNYAVTLGALEPGAPGEIDLAFSLCGVKASWRSNTSADTQKIWLPHLDLEVSRKLTEGSEDHERFWKTTASSGTLTLRSQLNLWRMLRPAIQPGSKLDYELPNETVSISFISTFPFSVKAGELVSKGEHNSNGKYSAQITMQVATNQWTPIEVALQTGAGAPDLAVAWHTAEDERPRALALNRMFLPWAIQENATETIVSLPIEIAGANWSHGRELFFGQQAACSTCHRLRGEGHLVGPDLSNLIHRDYNSVLKDIVSPNAATNPDHVSYQVELRDGESISGILQRETPQSVTLAQPGGALLEIPREKIKSLIPSTTSLMPEGIAAALGPAAMRDLLKFLLTEKP